MGETVIHSKVKITDNMKFIKTIQMGVNYKHIFMHVVWTDF